ncbi:MAG: type II toxin-antitoxin system HicA family toxin [Candidatus Vogelbacteria bacterium]|nr:type II toxin-antitoxin system HicA family toxin [Candidatus Vogelbacteria bacterium]
MSQGKLPVLTTDKLVRILLKLGFFPKRKKGSHLVLVKDRQRVVVPIHDGRDVPPGTLHNIIKQTGITRGQFIKQL